MASYSPDSAASRMLLKREGHRYESGVIDEQKTTAVIWSDKTLPNQNKRKKRAIRGNRPPSDVSILSSPLINTDEGNAIKESDDVVVQLSNGKSFSYHDYIDVLKYAKRMQKEMKYVQQELFANQKINPIIEIDENNEEDRCRWLEGKEQKRCEDRTDLLFLGFCSTHGRIMYGVEVKEASVEGLGKALFSTRVIRKGTSFLVYSGDVLTPVEFYNRYSGNNKNKYVIEVPCNTTGLKLNLWIDAADPNMDPVRYINDVNRTHNTINVQFQLYKTLSDHSLIVVVATQDIQCAEELWISYGNQFF